MLSHLANTLLSNLRNVFKITRILIVQNKSVPQKYRKCMGKYRKCMEVSRKCMILKCTEVYGSEVYGKVSEVYGRLQKSEE